MATIDHVVFAGPDLDRLLEGFEALGFEPEYGGEHSNGITHNYTVGFDDGSYIELISTLEAGQESPWWDAPIREGAGPCAWALPVEDIEAETRRLADLGIPVDGPTYYNRERPDGVLVEWDLTVVGEGALGSRLPFLVADRTPREYRITPSDGVRDTELVGVTEVVVCVADLDAAVDEFGRLFEEGTPDRRSDPDLGAELAGFEDAPLTLATPTVEGSWLTDRLEPFGDLPCAFLLGSEDANETADRFPLTEPAEWFGREVRWFDADLPGLLGVIG